ncbi:MAG: DNA double-strand break repair nuclease NurA [Anaerolineae bacterium]|nr:DNA double-strand break repair nuclease NurA [Anaerolineae bacterium]
MLELEKLSDEVEKMAQGAYELRQESGELLDDLLQKLAAHRTAWAKIDNSLRTAVGELGLKWYRSARPLDEREPLDAVVAAPPPPAQATVIASDGSQILPSRHGAYLYSVINIGTIVYYHGRGCAPFQTTHPVIDYPNGEDEEDRFVDDGAIVNIRRDLAEIETLVAQAEIHGKDGLPVLALLDQRLLYWPVGSGGNDEGKRVLTGWQAAMRQARECNCLLAGYIDRPGKRSVVTMLQTLDINKPGFDSNSLIKPPGGTALTDVQLFRQLLKEPGQRSKVFVDISQQNEQFSDNNLDNEVCFFYINSGAPGRQLARVDIPLWVAEDPGLVDLVHSLVHNQCQIMGGYPYVLTRADELAVVGARDRENLEMMIATAMERYGLYGSVTSKQSGKNVARAGRTRHTGVHGR